MLSFPTSFYIHVSWVWCSFSTFNYWQGDLVHIYWQWMREHTNLLVWITLVTEQKMFWTQGWVGWLDSCLLSVSLGFLVLFLFVRYFLTSISVSIVNHAYGCFRWISLNMSQSCIFLIFIKQNGFLIEIPIIYLNLVKDSFSFQQSSGLAHSNLRLWFLFYFILIFVELTCSSIFFGPNMKEKQIN